MVIVWPSILSQISENSSKIHDVRMSDTEFQLRGIDDVRLAIHATSSHPAWLWSVDGTRILWANPVAARLFGAPSSVELTSRIFGPAEAHRRQVAQLSGRLPSDGTSRLHRLRGFGAAFGSLATVACTRLAFADGGAGILMVAAQPAGQVMPLAERLKNLVEGVEAPIAAFARDGLFIGASDAARALRGFYNLAEAGLDAARADALKNGRVETPVGFGHVVLQRVGSGADIGLVALIAPGPTHVPPVATPSAAVQNPDEASQPAAPLESVVDVDPALAEPIEAVADEPAITIAAAAKPAPGEPVAFAPVETTAEPEDAQAAPTRPLRFTWQTDQEDHFSLRSDEFVALIGTRMASALGQRWSDIAATFALDPESRVATAIAGRRAWSGITLSWPMAGGERLPVELAGLPIIDRDQRLSGHRGFGICRDPDGLARPAEQPRGEPSRDQPEIHAPPRPLSADIAQAGPVGDDLDDPDDPDPSPPGVPIQPPEASHSTQPDIVVEQPKNVVQFRPADLKSPALTPVENNAFNELARQLSERLKEESEITAGQDGPAGRPAEPADAAIDPDTTSATAGPAQDQPDWLATPQAPARGELLRDKTLLDLMPVGVLIYRLDRLLYANPAFLARTGYPTLHALEEAGGLDALYVEPDVSGASSTSDGGTAVTISAPTEAQDLRPTEARLFTIAWDDEPALALIFASPRVVQPPATLSAEPLPAGHADAEELAAILDTTAEGIIMFDADGRILSCNRSAEALFGYDGDALTRRNLFDLFAPESQRAVRDYLDSVEGAGVASLLDHGREALGQVRAGGLLPLSITMGRTRQDGPNFFAIFRDLTETKRADAEMLNARRQVDRAASAKADVLARISHEVRTPLNAIIGFADVMTEERFGPLGNERYAEYMKDIRVSGERVIAIITDMLDLTRIETGKLDLAFVSQNLNEIVEQCVAVMQPQANRGRIIIRTSLAHVLPTVIADARALRQIALNLIGNSIHLANAGGQVIVSTALTDFGEVALRVRDTGHGMNDNELAAAMEPFRALAPADQGVDGAGVNLSLTKALVEANRARFRIKTAPTSGTLIEVVFSHARAKA